MTKEMKKIFVFSGLKIAEIGGVIGIYYILCLGFIPFNKIMGGTDGATHFWAGGFLMFSVIVITGFLGMALFFGGVALIKKNWEWAGKINEK